MKRCFLVLALLMGTPTGGSAQTPSADAVAGQVLRAFVARDVAQIARFSSDQHAGIFADVLAGRQTEALIFNNFAGHAAVNWDGTILPARYDGNRAIIPFAIDASPTAQPLQSNAAGRFFVVELVLSGPGDGVWRFDDLDFMPRDRYAALPASR